MPTPIIKTNINEKQVVILGTAHVSKKSIQDVERLIETEKPNIVAIELCRSRYKNLQNANRWKNLDILEVIKKKKIYLLMSSMILSAFQKKLGGSAGIKPGGEMLTAIEISKKHRLRLELIDRDIQITLKRAWQEVGYFGKILLISELFTALIFVEALSSRQIEKMKKKDILDEVFKNLPPKYNKIKKVLLEERDEYLAQKIKNALKKLRKNEKLLAIVGAGHLKGIQDNLKNQVSLKELESVRQRSRLMATIKFLIPVILILSLFFYFTGFDDPEKIYQNWIAWSIIKAISSGFFTIVVLAHPLAILSALVCAPISNFNPVLKPGWWAAFFEAKFRRPRVIDFENFAQDISSFRGFLKNKVSRVFILLILPQIGSSIGTGIALWYIAQ